MIPNRKRHTLPPLARRVIERAKKAAYKAANAHEIQPMRNGLSCDAVVDVAERLLSALSADERTAPFTCEEANMRRKFYIRPTVWKGNCVDLTVADVVCSERIPRPEDDDGEDRYAAVKKAAVEVAARALNEKGLCAKNQRWALVDETADIVGNRIERYYSFELKSTEVAQEGGAQ